RSRSGTLSLAQQALGAQDENHRHLAEKDQEDRLLERQLRCEHDSRHEWPVATQEDAEADPREIPGEKECEAYRKHDERPPPVSTEEEAESHIDGDHAGEADEERAEVDEVHAGTSLGPADRSPRTRFSTSSALIRHIGRPTPGTVVAPASSRPRTPRARVLPRRIALC